MREELIARLEDLSKVGFGYDLTKEDKKALIDAAAALARPEAAQVRVKALEWVYEEITCTKWNEDRTNSEEVVSSRHWDASPNHFIVTYNILEIVDPRLKTPISGFRLTLGNTDRCFESLEEAKAAAQADFDRRIRAALEPDTVTDQLSKSLADFVSRQEPLGAEFEQVLADNIEELYETQPDTATDTVTGWQDISTAPKGDDDLLVGWHCTYTNRFIWSRASRIKGVWYISASTGTVCHPTHYFALPPAPEKEG